MTTSLVLYPGDGFIVMNPPPYPLIGIQVHGIPRYLEPLVLTWGEERFSMGVLHRVVFVPPRNFDQENKPCLLEIQLRPATITTPFRLEWI